MPDPRPPFDLLRGAFYLVALLIIVMVVAIFTTDIVCAVGVLSGRFPVGTCEKAGLVDVIRDVWDEMLTALLALLVARPTPPLGPPQPPSDKEG